MSFKTNGEGMQAHGARKPSVNSGAHTYGSKDSGMPQTQYSKATKSASSSRNTKSNADSGDSKSYR